MAKAWIFQDTHQVKTRTKEKASWYVGWLDPDGNRCCKSCGPGAAGKNAAQKLRRKREAELIEGTYQSHAKKTWADFRTEYETKIVEGLAADTRRLILNALGHFEKIIGPKRMLGIRTQTIDDYRAERRKQRGKKPGSIVSPATLNKELRHLRAALKKAKKWKYLAEVPDFEFEREPEKLPTFISPEDFVSIYRTCDKAKLPNDVSASAADWWRGLLVMAYMTGWRIGELLSLRREDVDLDAGHALTRYRDNKGKRDAKIHLHPVVITHLRKLAGFGPVVFPWNRNIRGLYTEFARIQEEAGIHLQCDEEHEHSRFCYVYGFHDERRAFATMNADKLTGDALQFLMRHKSYKTTQKYINLRRQINPAVAALYVPNLGQSANA
jgi:integrase